MVTRVKNWIVYRTDSASAPGWEERLLMPRESLTDILWEHRTNSNKLPKVGDRVQRFENLEDPGNGATHVKGDDWVVTEVHEFASPTTNMRIVICFCEYSPIEPEWLQMKRGKPVDEMLKALRVGH